MSLHRSLKTKPSALNQHRNVLTRAERITRLEEQEKFKRDGHSPLGLVKVANRLVVAAKKPKKEAGEGEAGAEGATPAAGATPVAGAAAGKAPAGKVPAGKAPAAKAPAGKK